MASYSLAFSSERVDPLLSNASLIFHEIKDNEHWQHGIILYAMLETIFMALLGTMIASLVGLPLAFLAARNVQPVLAFRFVLRRSFDLLRGIDTLLWSLIFLRAFGARFIYWYLCYCVYGYRHIGEAYVRGHRKR